jgi:hypothetical protein
LRVYGEKHLERPAQKLSQKRFYLAPRNAQHATIHTTSSKNQVADFGLAVLLLFMYNIF